jgi:hypothetical protein
LENGEQADEICQKKQANGFLLPGYKVQEE